MMMLQSPAYLSHPGKPTVSAHLRNATGDYCLRMAFFLLVMLGWGAGSLSAQDHFRQEFGEHSMALLIWNVFPGQSTTDQDAKDQFRQTIRDLYLSDAELVGYFAPKQAFVLVARTRDGDRLRELETRITEQYPTARIRRAPLDEIDQFYDRMPEAFEAFESF